MKKLRSILIRFAVLPFVLCEVACCFVFDIEPGMTNCFIHKTQEMEK